MTLDAAQAKLNEAHAVQFTDADVKKLADYRSFREKVWVSASHGRRAWRASLSSRAC